jgi:predicted metal-dependent hydrolase
LFEALRSQGLVEDCQDAYLSWTERPNRCRMGYCSVLMRVVAISSALDAAQVPAFVPEYVLYHELLHLESGIEALSSQHDARFRRQERMHPRWQEAEQWLKRVASLRMGPGR